MCPVLCAFFFFFNDTATTEIYTLSLHDALPISVAGWPLDGLRLRRVGSRRSIRPVVPRPAPEAMEGVAGAGIGAALDPWRVGAGVSQRGQRDGGERRPGKRPEQPAQGAVRRALSGQPGVDAASELRRLA